MKTRRGRGVPVLGILAAAIAHMIGGYVVVAVIALFLVWWMLRVYVL